MISSALPKLQIVLLCAGFIRKTRDGNDAGWADFDKLKDLILYLIEMGLLPAVDNRSVDIEIIYHTYGEFQIEGSG
ncbi:hypothetical protein NMYAN_10144 [Nitrosomonas nitrosa]|uniref:Uncharacterized protein n=1 Tax=Nitrosomonas nitrosa TaxID=52442 RepID=A0A8H8YXP3_9PROT|nr:hypothetical protein NMYAN_10144 [Nitrosomonas nitrosa]